MPENSTFRRTTQKQQKKFCKQCIILIVLIKKQEMNVVSPANLLLLLLILFGYTALSLWLVNKNDNQNKLYWVIFILGIPFIGSTAYFINYLIQSDSHVSLTNK